MQYEMGNANFFVWIEIITKHFVHSYHSLLNTDRSPLKNHSRTFFVKPKHVNVRVLVIFWFIYATERPLLYFRIILVFVYSFKLSPWKVDTSASFSFGLFEFRCPVNLNNDICYGCRGCCWLLCWLMLLIVCSTGQTLYAPPEIYLSGTIQ